MFARQAQEARRWPSTKVRRIYFEHGEGNPAGVSDPNLRDPRDAGMVGLKSSTMDRRAGGCAVQQGPTTEDCLMLDCQDESKQENDTDDDFSPMIMSIDQPMADVPETEREREQREAREEREEDEHIDLMCLDFHLYMGSRRLIEWRSSELRQEGRADGYHPRFALDLVDTFLALFREKHPDLPVSEVMRFRLRMVKHACLLLTRLQPLDSAPTISELLEMRRLNANHPWGGAGADVPELSASISKLTAAISADRSFPLSPAQLKGNREGTLASLLPDAIQKLALEGGKGMDREAFSSFGTRNMVNWRDLLPGFIALTAHRAHLAEHNWSPTQQWMELAAEWMMQAVLEQYLVCGARGTGLVGEIFSYGYASARHRTEWNDEDDKMVNQMFAKAGMRDQREWRETLERAIQALIPPSNTSASAHFNDAARRYPIARFETRVVDFLQSLLESFPRPWIVQLEDGKLDFLSREETQQLKRELSWDG